MEQQILEMYQNGFNSSKIEKELHVTYNKVVTVLLKQGIDYRKEFLEKQESKYNTALEMYKSGKQFKLICKELGIGPNSLRPFIKEKVGEFRTQAESLKLNMDINEDAILKRSNLRKKYCIDENSFDDLNNEETAYWIGFLYADGTIGEGNGKYRISLTLKHDDKQHLIKFCKFLKTPFDRVKEVISTNSFQVTISSYYMWKKLRELGFTNKKSWNAIPPEKLLDSKHFWRGVVDGDGSLSIYERKGSYTNLLKGFIGLCGTPDTIQNFVYFLSDNLHKDFSLLKIDERTTTFSNFTASSLEDVLNITQLLYKDSNIYLERKFNKYLEIKEKLCINK